MGKAAREHTPRSWRGDWKAAKDREDPIASLEAQGTSRPGRGFSEACADQNERDHADLLAAIESGRLSALDA